LLINIDDRERLTNPYDCTLTVESPNPLKVQLHITNFPPEPQNPPKF